MTAPSRWADVEVGTELPAAVRSRSQRDNLVRYAGASGDFNVIHWNERVATSVGLPDVIAHGMLTMADGGPRRHRLGRRPRRGRRVRRPLHPRSSVPDDEQRRHASRSPAVDAPSTTTAPSSVDAHGDHRRRQGAGQGAGRSSASPDAGSPSALRRPCDCPTHPRGAHHAARGRPRRGAWSWPRRGRAGRRRARGRCRRQAAPRPRRRQQPGGRRRGVPRHGGPSRHPRPRPPATARTSALRHHRRGGRALGRRRRAAVARGLVGLEALSGIPGWTGPRRSRTSGPTARRSPTRRGSARWTARPVTRRGARSRRRLRLRLPHQRVQGQPGRYVVLEVTFQLLRPSCGPVATPSWPRPGGRGRRRVPRRDVRGRCWGCAAARAWCSTPPTRHLERRLVLHQPDPRRRRRRGRAGRAPALPAEDGGEAERRLADRAGRASRG